MAAVQQVSSAVTMVENQNVKEAFMYKLRWWSALLLGMLLGSMSGVAMADHGYGGDGHVGGGIVLAPLPFVPWNSPAPYYYPPYPYYYPPSVVTVPSSPPVYVERQDVAPPAPQASASWYYCANPQGYYPYVKECPRGWQAVAPQPPPPPGEGR